MSSELTPRPTPCETCPYRKDVPSGVWDISEYVKLVEYDAETSEQPPGVFLCHCGGGSVLCRGWLDVHDKEESLSLRLGVLMGSLDPAIMDLPQSGVPVFGSGRQAAEHGLRDIENPDQTAIAAINKLSRRRNKHA